MTKQEELNRQRLQELQADHTRWFSKEEFEELSALNALTLLENKCAKDGCIEEARCGKYCGAHCECAA